MNIVEKESLEFFKYKFYKKGGDVKTLDNLKDKLTLKLNVFNRDIDKLDFLKILMSNSIKDREQHLIECSTVNCPELNTINIALFAIEQELDDINKNYVFEANSIDKFTLEEELKIHLKLNSIIEELTKQGLVQDVILKEIESLKSHFNLGKRNWFQLLRGKLFELTTENFLDKVIVQNMYNTLSEGFIDLVMQIV